MSTLEDDYDRLAPDLGRRLDRQKFLECLNRDNATVGSRLHYIDPGDGTGPVHVVTSLGFRVVLPGWRKYKLTDSMPATEIVHAKWEPVKEPYAIPVIIRVEGKKRSIVSRIGAATDEDRIEQDMQLLRAQATELVWQIVALAQTPDVSQPEAIPDPPHVEDRELTATALAVVTAIGEVSDQRSVSSAAESSVDWTMPLVTETVGSTEVAQHADVMKELFWFLLHALETAAITMDDLKTVMDLEHPAELESGAMTRDFSAGTMAIETMLDLPAFEAGDGGFPGAKWLEAPEDQTFLATLLSGWAALAISRLILAGRIPVLPIVTFGESSPRALDRSDGQGIETPSQPPPPPVGGTPVVSTPPAHQPPPPPAGAKPVIPGSPAHQPPPPPAGAVPVSPPPPSGGPSMQRPHPQFSPDQVAALTVVHMVGNSLEGGAYGLPYSDSAHLERDLRILNSVTPDDGEMQAADQALWWMLVNLHGAGRFNKADMRTAMGLNHSDGGLSSDGDLQAFMSRFLDEAVWLGGPGGSAIDQYTADPATTRRVFAWGAQLLARFEQRGTVQLPDV